jgi:hypothetical protein
VSAPDRNSERLLTKTEGVTLLIQLSPASSGAFFFAKETGPQRSRRSDTAWASVVARRKSSRPHAAQSGRRREQALGSLSSRDALINSYGFGFTQTKAVRREGKRDGWFGPFVSCELSWPTRTLFLLWPRASDVPLGRARVKNLGPLQAVPVMARAMAERLV